MAAARRRCWVLLTELIFVLFCVVIAFIAMPRLCKRLGYSYFYDRLPQDLSLEPLFKANTHRAQVAGKYLKDHDFQQLFRYYALNKTQYCFIVITTHRQSNPLYLTQTTVQLIRQLSHLSSNYTFAIYNTGGKEHTEAVELSSYLPVIHKESVSRQHGNDHSKKGKDKFTVKSSNIYDRYEKEKLDYIFSLKWCLLKGSLYNIIIEDDAFADGSFAAKLEFLVRFSLSDKIGRTWGFIKLYYPEKFQGWGNHPSVIGDLLISITLLGLALTCTSALILPGPISTAKRRFKLNLTFYWRLLLSMCLILFLLLTLGRAHWEELKKYSPLLSTVVEARGCCSPAVLYPQIHLSSLISYLNNVTCSNRLPLDLALDAWINREALKKFLVIPNLFNHIGLISSLPKGWKNPQEFYLLFPPTM